MHNLQCRLLYVNSSTYQLCMYVYLCIYLFIQGTSFRLLICCFFFLLDDVRGQWEGQALSFLSYVFIVLYNAFPPQLNLLQAFAKTPDFIIVYHHGGRRNANCEETNKHGLTVIDNFTILLADINVYQNWRFRNQAVIGFCTLDTTQDLQVTQTVMGIFFREKKPSRCLRRRTLNITSSIKRALIIFRNT